MKTLGRIGFLLVALSLGTTGWGQAVFNKFGPAAGIQKNTGATYQNTAAAASDVTGLYSGCTGLSTQYLAANSTCQPVTSAVSGANPTGLIGLTAVNGSATTYTRSDAAPALSQAIAPTWSATHTFANTTANIVLNNSGGALDTKNTLFRESTAGFLFQSATDAAPTTAVTSIFTAARSGTAWTAINFGNATDNPTFSFLGTGQVSIAGGTVVGSPTGGNQGAGTINMQGCFVNGVACSTGGSSGANPTGTVGLTAVNGVAGTYMRSDAAPPLSQTISPTWTGVHTFSTTITSPPVLFTSTFAGGQLLNFTNTSNTATNRCWTERIGSTGTFTMDTCADSGTDNTANLAFAATRTAAAVTGLFFGNSTDNPTFLFQGSGQVTVNGSLQTPYLGVGRAPSSGVTRIVTDNGGSGDDEIVVQTTTAGNAQFRSVNLGGTNWSFGNLRSSGAFLLCNASTLTGQCYTFNTTGQVVLPAPTAGSTLNITGVVGGAAPALFLNGTAGSAVEEINSGLSLALNSSGTDFGFVENVSGNLWALAHGTSLTSLGTAVLTWNASGAVTINAASAANSLTVNGASGQATAEFQGNTTTGSGFGIRLDAGTNGSDYTMYWGNAATSTEYMRLYGDGGLVLGANPTGGNKGVGSINAKALYVNGAAVLTSTGAATKTAAGVVTIGASTCTVNFNGGGISSCTFNSTGNVTVTFTASYFGTGAACVVSGVNGVFAVALDQGSPTTSVTNVTLQSSAGVFVNGSFSIVCAGS